MIATNFLLLLAAAVVIYLSCEYFVNAIEWLGQKLGVGQTATGTVFAAFGTALPESVVTFVAVAFGASVNQQAIGVGAALAGPMVLSTITYGVVGLALIANRRKNARIADHVVVNHGRMSRDQGWFMSIFVVSIGFGLLTFANKGWVGILFLGAYALYVIKEMQGEDTEEEVLEPLKFQPSIADPTLGWVILQVVASLTIIFGASSLFVGQIETVGIWMNLPPQVVALILSPIATELPETMNAIIWVRQGKERLALANVSGAMMIQTTVPAAFGFFYTPWLLDAPLLLAAGVTMLAIATLFTMFRRQTITGTRLALVGLYYLIFVVGIGMGIL